MSPLNISHRQWLLMKDKRSLSFLTRVLWFSTNQGQEGEAMAPLPPPIRVGFTENAGRGIFATRKISLGDLIHKAQPVVAHPSPAYLHKVCYFCLKCVGMRTSASSWRSMSNEEISLLHEPITAHYACNESSPGSSGLDRSFRFCSVECEEHSKNEWPEMEEEFELLRCTFMEAGFKDEKIAILTKQWYVGVLARIRINAFRIELAGGISGDLLSMAAASVLAEAAVGNAVYILPSFYNHDCDPNVHILWLEDVNARLKALRDIEAGRLRWHMGVLSRQDKTNSLHLCEVVHLRQASLSPCFRMASNHPFINDNNDIRNGVLKMHLRPNFSCERITIYKLICSSQMRLHSI
ncbi:histone-lysine N-methyltransferase ATXR4 isoform X4 [Amborella trichopoda]|uniref:histone-lysine N-methyltransferase ATXR4 isoform X4 n=1 Tax=Amborella trichopoda TaxID=13333 RepID=UPI0009C06FE1|nr:histone-lysine N-methyltransferase ATXR4 isoform X4 [Amborella trichopoda]|eukprot:XP_020521922.1 histone-lysine N-methyltransferase ATXR4 isoform X4 [Amborella trichopoda]